jgi:RHS repeat-associated protein
MQIDIDSVAQYCYTIDVPFVYKPISTYNILAYSNDNEYSSNNQNNAYSFYDQLGRSKEYVFNNQGNIISETNVKGDKIQYIYNESSCNCGSAASIKYPNGLIIEKEYDIKGNLTKVFNTFTKATTKYAYHTIKGIDVVDTITNALGQQTIYGYDTLSNLISIMEPDGNISYISYNNQSLPVTFTDQQGNISRTIYDSLGQAIASINPKGDSTIYDYDEFGNIRTITDPQGRSINYNYDIMDRMISETDAAGNITRYSYNNMSELDSLIDPMGHVTTFNYDAGGNLIKTTNHFGISRNYNYDEQGKLISYENARGQQILYQYDNLGQLLRKSTQEDSTIARYGYDNMGNMTIAANKNISINRFYDLSGRLVSESQSILKLNDTLSDNDTISADDFSKDYSNLVINGDTVIIDGEHHYLSISLINGAVVKHLATDLDFVHKCNITARDFIWVDTDSKIDVTGLGYLGGGRDGNDTTLGRTKGNSLTEGSTPGSGGSHGGKGGAFTFGSSTIGLSARTYDDKLWPTYPGSGGGSNGNPGFNGGGVIYLDAPRIIVDGNLVANGEDALNDNGGAGAGGSIIVKADSLLGSGEIKANGGNGIEGYEKPRGGGGGRILISANIITPVIKFPFGGLCGGSCGSLWYKNTFGYYVLESVFQGDSIHKIDYQDTIYNNSNIIVDGTTLIINGQHAFKSIKIISGGVLSHDNPNEDTNCLGSILRVSNQIDIDPSSRIDLVGKGYAGSIGNLCAQTINRQCGATGLSGGSYGGKGADLNGSSGDEYGDPHNPHELGSGGAQLNGNIESKGGNGGGHITIFCPKINLNGNIIANGSLGLLGGAGSGGSIIIHTDTILGMGEIKADGGSYNYPGQPFTGGGGGGGRIAIFTRDNNTLNLNKIHARGGYGAKNGLPGTIYLSANDSLIREYNKYPTVIYKDTTISLTASDKHLDSTSITLDGSYLTIQGKHSFENLTVSNWSTIEMNDSLSVNVLKILDNGYITQSYPTITNDSIKTYAMHIIAKEIYIEEYGILWATGSGYPGGWPQIDSQITLSPFVGGSHGGNGGGWYKGWLCDSNEAQFTGCSIGESGTIFDSYKFPNLPGGGGGNKAEPGCSGGGIIDLKCDLLYNKGKIFADGNMQFNIDNPKGAGAGGSILIRSSKIMGNGIYSAIGGLVYIYDRGRPPLARSGGGGRIAIHCPEIPSNLIDNLFVNSGKCNQYRLGTGAGTGSIFISKDSLHAGKLIYKGDGGQKSNWRFRDRNDYSVGPTYLDNINFADDTLSIQNAWVVLRDTSTNKNITNVNVISGYLDISQKLKINFLTIDSGDVLSLTDTLKIDTLQINNNGNLTTHYSETGTVQPLNLVSHRVNILPGGKIDVSRRGCRPGYRDDGSIASNDSTAGGSHAGKGGGNSCGTYGDIYNPHAAGAGGGQPNQDIYYPKFYNRGGGVVYIKADTILLNGGVFADGIQDSTAMNKSGGSAGGSIIIKAGAISGNGTIRSSGGNELQQSWGPKLQAGGGGRIAVYADNAQGLFLEKMYAWGYNPGTIYLNIGDQPQLRFGGNLSKVHATTYSINDSTLILNISGNTQVKLASGSRVHMCSLSDTAVLILTDSIKSDSIILNNRSMISNEIPQPFAEQQLSINTRYLYIDTIAAVDVSDKGYPNGYNINWDTLSRTGYSIEFAGTHAGRGRSSIPNRKYVGKPYGNFWQPTAMGGGSGLIDFFCTYNPLNCSSGAHQGGGAISLQCQTIKNYGKIAANGGSYLQNYTYYGGGGGGSVSILCGKLEGTGQIQANGGFAGYLGGGGRIAIEADTMPASIDQQVSASGGAAGTILISDRTIAKSKLLVDNNNTTAEDTSTWITSVGSGTISRATADTLECATCNFPVYGGKPGLSGLHVTINPTDINDAFAHYTILWNDKKRLALDTIGGRSLLVYASVGQAFCGVIKVDTIIIRRGGRAYSTDPILYERLILTNGKLKDPLHGIQTGYAAPQKEPMRYGANGKTVTDTGIAINSRSVNSDSHPATIFERIACGIRQRMAMHRAKREERQEVLSGAQPSQTALMVQPGTGFITSLQNVALNSSAFAGSDKSQRADGKGINASIRNNQAPTHCDAGDPAYTYDMLDRVTSMASPAGVTRYHYDTHTGQLDSIISPEGKAFGFTYDRGRLTRMSYPNGISVNYTFDENDNLTDLHYQKEDGSTVKRYQYAYDKNGMRTSMQDNDGLHEYTYDSLYQIIQATHPTVQNPLERFEYDAAGNRLSDEVKSAYQYNELNQLTEDDSDLYNYDADGNMTEKISKETGDTTRFVWDVENRLVEVRKPGMTVKYAYDALRRRMSKTVNAITTQFRYDGDNLILEIDDKDSIEAAYTFGLGIDNPIAMHRNGGNYYYEKDGLGSVSALTDSIAVVVKEYKYTVFGQIIAESGEDIENPFTYTSRELDVETGNYYYRARYYNAEIGRFLGEDPIGIVSGEINLYRFVWNSPLAYIDPLGLEGENCIIKWFKDYTPESIKKFLLNAIQMKVVKNMFPKPSNVIDQAQAINALYRLTPGQNAALQQLELNGGVAPSPGTGSNDSARTAQTLNILSAGLKLAGE